MSGDTNYARVKDTKLGQELTIRAVALGNGLIAIPKYGPNQSATDYPKGTQKITLDEQVQVRVTNELTPLQARALDGLFGGDDE